MKEYILNYYPKFSCIKGGCKHSCCAGWEINIDGDTLDFYKEQETFKEELKKGINFRKAKFKLKNKRCAFLNKEGLCDIIINLGEDALCQVCTDHPRFRSFFSDRMETGIGFCCEEATRIILSSTEKIGLIKTSDDLDERTLDFNEQKILEFRNEFISVIQDREKPINDRVKRLLELSNAKVEKEDFKRIKRLFLSFERVEKAWGENLKLIKNFNCEIKTEFAIKAEHFLTNFAFRHFSTAEDTFEVRGIAVAGVISLFLVNTILETKKSFEFENFVEIFRSYSTEVEYSNKNLYKLYDFCQKFVKI